MLQLIADWLLERQNEDRRVIGVKKRNSRNAT